MGEVEVQALRGVDLDIFAGEFLVLLGHSGSGRSTVLNIVGGLDTPSTGTVRYRDHELTSATDPEPTVFRRDHVGFAFQFYNLTPSLTARENVEFSREGTSEMRVAINGMGIAGPTLAYWLRRSGHDPVLFEKAPAVRTGGYLIDFWGIGYEIAERMGIISTLRERGYEMKRLQMVDRNGREEAHMDLTPLYEAQRGRFISVARADLASALAGACQGIPIHFNVSISAIAKDGAESRVTLTDGRQERFDLVVGADGLHSQVRALALGPEARFERFLDCYVAAFRVRGYPHRDELTFVSHTVRGRQASRVSLRDDETVVMLVCGTERIGADHRGHGDPRPALRQAYGEMGWEVPELLDAMDTAEDVYFDRVSQIHLPRWGADGVALVGDAAACPSLLAGEGSGLGMLEAYVLAGELHRADGDCARALAAYEGRLRKFVSGKQKGAIWFRGFFAPQTNAGLMVRNLAVRAFALPWLGKPFWARSLHDDFTLPEYQMG